MSRGMGKDKRTVSKEYEASPDVFGGLFYLPYVGPDYKSKQTKTLSTLA